MRILLSAIVLALSLSVLAQDPLPSELVKEPPEAATRNHTTPDAKGQQHHDYFSSEWWLVYVTGFLVLATIGLMGYTARLWNATKTLAEDAKRTGAQQASDVQQSLRIAAQAADAATVSANTMKSTAVLQLRAYVGVHEFQQAPLSDAEGNRVGWKFVVRWRNSGLTPTSGLMCFLVLQEFLSEMPTDHPFPVPDLSDAASGELGANAAFNIGGPEITLQRIDQIRSGARKAYAFCRATYRDVIANEQHQTDACFQLVVVNDPLGSHVPFEFVFYPRHNGAS